MPFVPVPNTVMVEVRCELDGQQIENTLYFSKPDGWNAETGIALGGDILTWWTTLMSVPLADAVNLVEIYVTDLSSATGFAVSQPAPVPAPSGDVALPAGPNQNALCVSFKTAFRGRSFRGRNYVSGYAREDVSSNDLSVTRTAETLAAYNGLFPIANAWGGDWVVVSRYSGKLPNGDPAPRVTGIATPITAVVAVDRTIDSQRRRTPGRGN